ncbi:hypothetical protein [Rhizomicrobium palustre]|uniref:hypothetical protein n=1 Tax=Rhizomicrobium palustre TaxID=189966 RepID=UPI00142078A3|nr:hypothetical protein [Rhizomicrobium palustre]
MDRHLGPASSRLCESDTASGLPRQPLFDQGDVSVTFAWNAASGARHLCMLPRNYSFSTVIVITGQSLAFPPPATKEQNKNICAKVQEKDARQIITNYSSAASYVQRNAAGLESEFAVRITGAMPHVDIHNRNDVCDPPRDILASSTNDS